MAIQTALDKALVQWPFLRDTSLLSAITAVFVPAPSSGAGTDAARTAAVAAAAGALDMTLLQPWLYYNILLLNSQLFIPVLDKVSCLCSLKDRVFISMPQPPHLLMPDECSAHCSADVGRNLCVGTAHAETGKGGAAGEVMYLGSSCEKDGVALAGGQL